MRVIMENVGGEGPEYWTLRLEGYGTVPSDDLFRKFNRLIGEHSIGLDLRPVSNGEFQQYECCQHGMICLFESLFWTGWEMLSVGEALAVDMHVPFELV